MSINQTGLCISKYSRVACKNAEVNHTCGVQAVGVETKDVAGGGIGWGTLPVPHHLHSRSHRHM